MINAYLNIRRIFLINFQFHFQMSHIQLLIDNQQIVQITKKRNNNPQ